MDEIFLNAHGSAIWGDIEKKFKEPKTITLPPKTKLIVYTPHGSALQISRAIETLKFNHMFKQLSVEERLRKIFDVSCEQYHRAMFFKYHYSQDEKITLPNLMLSELRNTDNENELKFFGKAIFLEAYMNLKDIEKKYNILKSKNNFNYTTLGDILPHFQGKTIHLLCCRSVSYTPKIDGRLDGSLKNMIDYICKKIRSIILSKHIKIHHTSKLSQAVEKLHRFSIYSYDSLRYASQYLYGNKNLVGVGCIGQINECILIILREIKNIDQVNILYSDQISRYYLCELKQELQKYSALLSNHIWSAQVDTFSRVN